MNAYEIPNIISWWTLILIKTPAQIFQSLLHSVNAFTHKG